MAEDDQVEPTLDDYRALLAAARLFEASTRPVLNINEASTAGSAYGMVRYFHRASGPFADPGDAEITLLESEGRWAASRVYRAVVEPVERRRPGGIKTTGDLAGAILAMTPDERSRLGAAIDALAAMIDLMAAVGSMSPEASAAVEKLRPGRRPRNTERNARIAELSREYPKAKAGEIAARMKAESEERGWGTVTTNIVYDHWNRPDENSPE